MATWHGHSAVSLATAKPKELSSLEGCFQQSTRRDQTGSIRLSVGVTATASSDKAPVFHVNTELCRLGRDHGEQPDHLAPLPRGLAWAGLAYPSLLGWCRSWPQRQVMVACFCRQVYCEILILSFCAVLQTPTSASGFNVTVSRRGDKLS